MMTYALIILFAMAIGLAVGSMAMQPRALRWAWPAVACLTGALLGLPVAAVLAVTVVAAALTWPVRRAWA